MTFIERPMPTDSADICVWRDSISGATVQNEGSGGSTYDLTSSGGVSVDTMAAPFFSALATSSQAYLTGNVAQFDMSSGFAISCWLRTTTVGSLDRVLLKQNQSGWTSPQYDTALIFDSSANLSGGYIGGNVSATGADDVAAGEWVHTGVTINSAEDTYKFYLRGILIGSDTYSASLGSDNGPWYVGGRAGGDNFQGHIWDVRIAQTERPLSWFKESYVRGLRFFGSS